MKDLIINIYLFAGAYRDGRTKKIPVWYLWIGAILGMGCRIGDIFLHSFLTAEWIWGMVPGLLFLLGSVISKEKIGDGDGWVLLILGNCKPGRQVWRIFYLSVLILLSYALILILFRKADKKEEIPYLPFLWTADVVIWGLKYVL